MSVTGGLLGVRRAGAPVSAPAWSSALISALSSDISIEDLFDYLQG